MSFCLYDRPRAIQIYKGHIFWKEAFKFLDQNTFPYVDCKILFLLFNFNIFVPYIARYIWLVISY